MYVLDDVHSAVEYHDMKQSLKYAGVLLALFCGSLTPAQASAQETVAGSIRGTVVNADDRPIEDADVLLEQLRSHIRTSAAGRFAFIGVKNGKYTVVVRAIGYETQTVKLTVRDSIATVNVRMVRAPFSLPAKITTASRGGLSGVVADTGYHPLADVRVQVLGASLQAQTDSLGKFFLPVLPGRYLVRMDRNGFARQLIGVTVPENEGREIAAWMVPRRGSDNPQVGANLFDLNQRLMRTEPATAKMYSRQDIDKLGKRDVLTLIREVAGYPVASDCRVWVNGGPLTKAIWELYSDNVEFVEIVELPKTRQYGGPVGGSRDGLNITKMPLLEGTKGGDCKQTGIGVWTRQD